MENQFFEEYYEIKNQALLSANRYFFKNMNEIVNAYRASLAEAAQRLKEMQQKGYQDIEYMEITLLRTRILEHDYHAPIMVYGSKWFADTYQKQVGEIDTTNLFSFFEEMIQETVKLSKKYKSKLPERIIEECMCLSVEDFWNYVDMACRQASMGFETEEIGITEAFRIRCSEYMGFGEVLWRYTPEMSEEQLKKWFAKKEPEVYRYRDFSSRNFSGWDFTRLDLTGCDFRNCNLEGCNFEGADLTDAWLSNSCLKQASIQGVWMPGARFDHANLQEAVLEGAYSASEISSDTWLRPDNVPASFVCADLRKADLTYSAIECADFTDADLKGALFLMSHEDYYQFDDKQKTEFLFADAMEEE